MRDKITVMILPVGLRCNMRCGYCYHEGIPRVKDRNSKMFDEVLRKLIHDSANLAKDVDFLWHGGEPLLAGRKHFETAITVQHEVRFVGNIRNLIQTNGILLGSDSLCRFLAENRFLVSTSLDGSAEANDANRILASGQGTYRLVLKGIQSWKQAGNQIGVVALITRANVGQPVETYRSLKNAGLKSCAFHICSQNDEGSVDAMPSPEETANFLKSVFNIWFEEDDPTFLVRNFRNVLRVMCGGTTVDCASRVDGCRGFIAVTANGDVYPCHRFVNRDSFRLGNVQEKDLAGIYKDSESVYAAMCSLPEDCKSCTWLNACGGGCAYERIVHTGSFQATDSSCGIRKDLFNHIKASAGALTED